MRVVCPYCRREYDGIDNNFIGMHIQCEDCGRDFIVGCDRRVSSYAGAVLLFRAAAFFMVVFDGYKDQHLTLWMWYLCCLLVVLGFVYNIAYLVRWYAKKTSTAVLARFPALGFVDTILCGAISVAILLVAISKILQ